MIFLLHEKNSFYTLAPQSKLQIRMNLLVNLGQSSAALCQPIRPLSPALPGHTTPRNECRTSLLAPSYTMLQSPDQNAPSNHHSPHYPPPNPPTLSSQQVFYPLTSSTTTASPSKQLVTNSSTSTGPYPRQHRSSDWL